MGIFALIFQELGAARRPCEAIIETQSGREIGACGQDRGPSGEIGWAGRVKPCSAR